VLLLIHLEGVRLQEGSEGGRQAGAFFGDGLMFDAGSGGGGAPPKAQAALGCAVCRKY
jgi:hypothetical protein